MKIALGSKNPAKLKAVKTAFEKMFPNDELIFVSLEVDSGVADQPLNDEETVKGAINRAKRALESAKADYGVGVEGGIHKVDSYWLTGNIAAVVTKNGNTGVGISTRVALPKQVQAEIERGAELNTAIASVYGLQDVGKKGGVLGLFTNGHTTRATASCDAVIAAIGFLQRTR